MIIEFEKEKHIYFVDGEIATISNTELLAKHKLAPDYSGVSKAKLKESAERGKAIHEDLENIMNSVNYKPKTKQGEQFLEWSKKNLDCGVGEQMLAYRKDGMVIACTADLIGFMKDGRRVIIDYKVMQKIHREYVSWQTSVEDFIARELKDEAVNGKQLNWKGAELRLCIQFNPATEEMIVHEIDTIDDVEIRRLLDCEFNGEIYQRPMLVVDPELEKRFLQAEEALFALETKRDEIEEISKKCRQELCQLMKDQGILSWETSNKKLRVTYVAESESSAVDTKKLKDKFPKVWEECQTVRKKCAYVLVKTREQEEDGE